MRPTLTLILMPAKAPTTVVIAAFSSVKGCGLAPFPQLDVLSRMINTFGEDNVAARLGLELNISVSSATEDPIANAALNANNVFRDKSRLNITVSKSDPD